MIKVSVILPVYNAEKYIRECLNSILMQTLDDIEIICIDDASTDGTKEILAEYARSYSMINIITNAVNSYAGVSRNRGLEMASGKYVIFLDADDIYECDMLEKAYVKAELLDADVCIFQEDQFVDGQDRHLEYPYNHRLLNRLSERGSFSPSDVKNVIFSLWNGWAWDKLFAREYIIDTGLRFQKMRSSEDAFFVHAAIASAKRITVINEVLVHHRIGNSNSVSNTRDKAWESCLLYLKELRRYLMQRKRFSIYEKSYINWSADFLYWNYQTLNDVNREKLAASMREFFLFDLMIEQYEKEYFYNAFSWWFVRCIIYREDNAIPLTEKERYEKVYGLNAEKIETLHKYMSEHNWKVAIWGAGIRGCAFARIYRNVWTELRTVYDMDESKWGKELCSGITVRGFDGSQAEKTDCIIVLNSAHLLSVQKLVPEGNITLFDMNTYLNLCDRLEECFISCEE